MSALANPVFRRLFAAQVLALLGTGLATVALGLLAYRLAGAEAGTVLGVLLAIKMTAYVLVAPVVTAVAARVPTRAFLVSMDVLRAVVAGVLPLVDALWQVYALVVLLQVAAAAFTPTYQATVPAVLTDERDYTQALSLSRLAFELEALLSPVLAAGLLLVLTPVELFFGTALGFLASALLVAGSVLPRKEIRRGRTGGLRTFLGTPALRALLGLNLATAAGGALVLVNTVVLVRDRFGGTAVAVAVALGCYGAGSVLAALVLPRTLRAVSDRAVLLGGGSALAGTLGLGALWFAFAPGLTALLVLWAVLGAAGAVVQTPVGRLVRRSGSPDGWAGLFAAQFTLSHAAWLVTYLLAGLLGPGPLTFAVLGGLAALGVLFAVRAWPPVRRHYCGRHHGRLLAEPRARRVPDPGQRVVRGQ
ncbi:MFS transporter [Crossiella sp. CA198]|uniref:MFS transporter n=1 Tax=Crossiella sp. CA198 TaxID=3455607 RepID=UPI003F8D526F